MGAGTRTAESDPNAVSRASSPASQDDFAGLFAKHQRALWLIAVSMVRDHALAEDIVQEAAITAYRKFDHFEPGSNFGAWMGQIVRNIALNQARKRRNRREAGVDPGDLQRPAAPEQPPTLAASQAGRVPEHQGWFDDVLLRALEALAEIPRACLLLRTIEGLSYAEIAGLLEIPEGTAMSHVHRSRSTLRQQLASAYGASRA